MSALSNRNCSNRNRKMELNKYVAEALREIM